VSLGTDILGVKGKLREAVPGQLGKADTGVQHSFPFLLDCQIMENNVAFIDPLSVVDALSISGQRLQDSNSILLSAQERLTLSEVHIAAHAMLIEFEVNDRQWHKYDHSGSRLTIF